MVSIASHSAKGLRSRKRLQVGSIISNLLLPLLVGSCTLFTTQWLWEAANLQERQQIERKVQLAAETVRNEMQARLDSLILGLQPMASRWEKRGQPTRREWTAAMEAYLNVYPNCQTVQWLNSSLKPRWTVSREGTGEEPLEELHQQAIARYQGQWDDVMVVPSVSAEGIRQLWVYIPLVHQGERYGFLFAAYETEGLFKTILDRDILPQYGLSVFEGRKEIFSRLEPDKQNLAAWGQEITLPWDRIAFKALIWPSAQLLAQEQSSLPEWLLIGGVAFSVSLTLALYSAQRAGFRSKQVELINLLLKQEIKERKQTEAALRQHTQMLDLANDTIMIRDLDDAIAYWNQGAERLYGWKKEEAVGKYVHKLLQTTFPQLLEEIRAVCLRQGYWQGELSHTKRDGAQVTVASCWTLQRDEQGQPTAILEINNDISDRKRTEAVLHRSEWQLREQATRLEQALQELQHTQAQLVQSEKMSSLGQLVAGVAHEINNPVNFIYGNLVHASEYAQDLLGLLHIYQQQYPNPSAEIQEEIEAIDFDFLKTDLPKLLSSMKVGADRIREIVQSLRNFSRIDEAEIKEVDLHEGLDSTLMILQNRLKAKSDHPAIQVIKEYGKLPLVECYAGQLNQVFMNILTNAIDALEEVMARRSKAISHEPETSQEILPTIRIFTEVLDKQWVSIQISDNGPGIPEDVKSKLFDPFFTTKPVGKGTGIGLSISYQIVVEKHKGELRCLSQPGQGTKFIIEVPIRQVY